MAFLGHILPGMGTVAVARDRDDRDASIERFDEAGHQVGCPRAERRIANTGAVGDPGISVSGKGAAALVVDQMMVQPDKTHRVVKRQKLEPAHAEHRPGARQTQHLGDRPPVIAPDGRFCSVWAMVPPYEFSARRSLSTNSRALMLSPRPRVAAHRLTRLL